MKTWPPLPFFVSAVALIAVGVLTTLELTCPVCGGTGSLEAARGLTVKDTEIHLIKDTPVHTFGECGTPVQRSKFTYAVDMTVVNGSNEASKGTVKVSFSRYPPGFKTFMQDAEGAMVEVEYMPPTVPAFLEVPAGATRKVHLVLSYIDDILAKGEAPPQAFVEAGADMTDPTCGGTGVLSFVHWIQAKLRPPSFE